MTTVRSDIMAYLVEYPQSLWTSVPVTLTYDTADPFAIIAVFGDGVVWMLARDLLRAGLEQPVGEGDVRLWPNRTPGDALFMRLRVFDTEAIFEMSRSAVAVFIRQTEMLVPPGAEQLDEVELKSLLDQ